MNTFLDSESALIKLIEIVGGQSALAKKLKIKQPSVAKWKRRGRAPSSRIVELERLSNGAITRHEFRPDIYPLD